MAANPELPTSSQALQNNTQPSTIVDVSVFLGILIIPGAIGYFIDKEKPKRGALIGLAIGFILDVIYAFHLAIKRNPHGWLS